MLISRNKSIDIARGIAMIAIILGHLGIPNINRVVFTFHIPIFYLITGYFLTIKKQLGVFIFKRFRTLIVPYYVACAGMIISAVFFNFLRNRTKGDGVSSIYVIREWLYASLYGAGDSYDFPFNIKGIGAIWFLWATFWGITFLSIIFKSKPVYHIFEVSAIFAAGYFTRKLFWFPLSIQAGCCATFFMYIGYLVRQIEPYYKNISDEIKISLFIVSLTAWINFIIQFQSFWLVHCDIGRGPLDVIGSLCACYVLIVICHSVENSPVIFISKGLAFLGQNSLFMLAAHIIELHTFPWDIMTDWILKAGYTSTIQLAAILTGKFIWIIGITIICAKTNWIRRLFGMKTL